MFRNYGDYKRGEEFHRRAHEIILNKYPETHPDALEALSGLANIYLRTNAEKAENLFRRLLEIREKVYGDRSPQYAWTLYNLAFLTNNQKRFSEAREFANEILALRNDPVNDEHPVISAATQMSAIALMGMNETEKAETLLRESLALREKTLAADHWVLDTSKSILGECLIKNGKVDEALKLLNQSYKNLNEKLGAEHEQTVNALVRVEKFN